MLQITPQHTILLAVHPVDFRRNIDGLAALCKQTLMQDPFSGTLFVFTNKKRQHIKIVSIQLCEKSHSAKENMKFFEAA